MQETPTGGSEFEDEYDAWLRGEEHKIRGEILKSPLSQLEPRPPVTVAPDTPIADCLDLLRKHHIGCLLVTEDDRPVGIFTERDVVKKVAGHGLVSTGAAVREVMTPEPQCLKADARIVVALNRMVVGGYRHIPIVDDGGKAVGILSVRNFVRFIVSLYPEAVLNQPPSQGLKHPNRINGG